MNENINPLDIEITMTEEEVLKELAPCNGEFSAQVMQLMIEFTIALATLPKQCLTRTLTLPRGLELLASITSKLWGIYVDGCESEAQALAAANGDAENPGPGKLGIALKAMRLEQAEAKREEKLVSSDYFFGALSAICASEHGLDAFRQYVRRRVSLPKASEVPEKKSDGGGVAARKEKKRPLSKGQEEVFDFCLRIGELFYSGQSALPEIKIRSFPLIVGPTGAGKTHVVRQLADELDCHYMRLDYGTWMPRGSKESVNTMEAICDAALKYERVLVHLDELDKLRSDYSSGWEISVKNDIWKLLDRPIDLSHIAEAQSFEQGEQAFAEMFAQRVWIVGSGTWQEVFDSRPKSIGFAADPEDPDSHRNAMVDRIHESQLIAPELTGRFNSKLQLIQYPKVEEAAELLAHSGIDLSKAQVDQLRETLPRSGFRAVEDAVTEVALERFEAMQRDSEPSQDEMDLGFDSEPCMLSEAAARVSETEETRVDSLEEVIDDDCDCEFGVIAPGFYEVNFPFSERLRYVDVSHAPGGRLKLNWYRCVHGVQCSARNGFTRGRAVQSCEPVRFMELWSDFARRYGCMDFNQVEPALFRTWQPRPCDKPPTLELDFQPGDLLTFWRRQDRDHDADIERLDEIAADLHEMIQPESRRRAHLDARYQISETILCSVRPDQASDEGSDDRCRHHTGPTLTELRQQYENYLNEGLEWFYLNTGAPKAVTGRAGRILQERLMEWEDILIEAFSREIQSGRVICETVACPPKIRFFLDMIEPDLAWEKMSTALQDRFRTVSAPYLSAAVPF